ncbi:MAG: transglycosylase SLT domain-containing protein [Armatimonadetes bacterium]|nr:transglycosylase SLT domain-containing protein [Armatimonadota bacterium]
MLGSQPSPPVLPPASADFEDAFQLALSNQDQPAHPSRSSSRLSPADVDPLVQAAARKYGLNPALVHAVITAESDYDPMCVSHAGAMGLMQLMPETARAFRLTNPFDPAQNIDAGCRELKQYIDRFKRLDLALAAYNAGPGAVLKYGGIPPFPETQTYVRKVLNLFAKLAASDAPLRPQTRPNARPSPPSQPSPTVSVTASTPSNTATETQKAAVDPSSYPGPQDSYLTGPETAHLPSQRSPSGAQEGASASPAQAPDPAGDGSVKYHPAPAPKAAETRPSVCSGQAPSSQSPAADSPNPHAPERQLPPSAHDAPSSRQSDSRPAAPGLSGSDINTPQVPEPRAHAALRSAHNPNPTTAHIWAVPPNAALHMVSLSTPTGAVAPDASAATLTQPQSRPIPGANQGPPAELVRAEQGVTAALRSPASAPLPAASLLSPAPNSMPQNSASSASGPSRIAAAAMSIHQPGPAFGSVAFRLHASEIRVHPAPQATSANPPFQPRPASDLPTNPAALSSPLPKDAVGASSLGAEFAGNTHQPEHVAPMQLGRPRQNQPGDHFRLPTNALVQPRFALSATDPSPSLLAKPYFAGEPGSENAASSTEPPPGAKLSTRPQQHGDPILHALPVYPSRPSPRDTRLAALHLTGLSRQTPLSTGDTTQAPTGRSPAGQYKSAYSPVLNQYGGEMVRLPDNLPESHPPATTYARTVTAQSKPASSRLEPAFPTPSGAQSQTPAEAHAYRQNILMPPLDDGRITTTRQASLASARPAAGTTSALTDGHPPDTSHLPSSASPTWLGSPEHVQKTTEALFREAHAATTGHPPGPQAAGKRADQQQALSPNTTESFDLQPYAGAPEPPSTHSFSELPGSRLDHATARSDKVSVPLPHKSNIVHHVFVRIDDDHGGLSLLASNHSHTVYAHALVRDPVEAHHLEKAFPALQSALQNEQINLAALSVSIDYSGTPAHRQPQPLLLPLHATVETSEHSQRAAGESTTTAPTHLQGLLHIYA